MLEGWGRTPSLATVGLCEASQLLYTCSPGARPEVATAILPPGLTTARLVSTAWLLGHLVLTMSWVLSEVTVVSSEQWHSQDHGSGTPYLPSPQAPYPKSTASAKITKLKSHNHQGD